MDGARNWAYCENLSYLSKLFLDHKYLGFSIDLFLFYVLCKKDEQGFHIAGYFSKSRSPEDLHNLSCILVLPFYQKQGLGKFLINFSYALSEIEKKIGTPEKPLSDLGKKGYLSYWSERLLRWMINNPERIQNITILDISKNTYVKEEDVVMTLEHLNIFKRIGGKMYFCTDADHLKALYEKMRKCIPVNKNNIHWIPYHNKYGEIGP